MTEAQTSLEIPENMSFALKILLPEQRQQVYDFVEFLLHKQQIANSQKQQQTDLVGLRQTTTERILGLHQGQGSISDDFAQPLPDELWHKTCPTPPEGQIRARRSVGREGDGG